MAIHEIDDLGFEAPAPLGHPAGGPARRAQAGGPQPRGPKAAARAHRV